MSLNITKEALMDNISEIPEEFVIEAEYTEEELKRLGAPARGKAAVVAETPKKENHVKEMAPTQADEADDDIEPQPVAVPKRKAATIIWITTGVALAAAAILLFVFLWNPDRRDVVTTTEAETTEVMSTEARTEEVVPTEAGTTEETEGATTEVKVESDPEKIRKVNVGDYISFGSYEQDNDLENGKEAIEWLVLDKKEDKMLVISRYALDSKPYNVDEAEVTWETCTLREWLNSVFYSDAFASNEKSMVIDATVMAAPNPSYNTPAGNDTTDKVFLLSFDEFARYYDDFDDNRFKYCQRTQYCSVQALMGDRSDPYAYGGNCYWWLRSPGDDPDWAMCVNFQGGVYDLGNPVNISGITVRPAMWITVGTDNSQEETEEVLTTEEVTTEEEPTTEAALIDPSEGLAIDEAHFPDAIFRNEVSELYDKDHDGQLNETEIKKIVGINVNNMGVSSLKGVEYFTALTRLNCEGNNISELDLTQNVNLVSIKCKGNQLTKLDVSKASALETLDCSRNQLTELNVENNPGIYSLLCGENRLTGLDIHNIMTELYLQVDVNVNVIGANERVNIQRVNPQTEIPGEIVEGTNTLRLDNASYHWDADNDGREDWNVNRAKLTDSVLILDGPFTLTIFGDEDGDPDTVLHFDRDYTEIPLGENVKYTYNAFDSNPEMINKGLGESHPINSLFFTINEGVITELGTFIGG